MSAEAVRRVPPRREVPLLEYIPDTILIPPYYILLFASISCCLLNAGINFCTRKSGELRHTFDAWRRVLHISTKSHIVHPPQTTTPAAVLDEEQRRWHMESIASRRAQAFVTDPLLDNEINYVGHGVDSPYDSAAFFRGLATASPPPAPMVAMTAGGAAPQAGAPMTVSGAATAFGTAEAPAHLSPSAASFALSAGVGGHPHHHHHPGLPNPTPENPPAAVPATVVAEALSNSLVEVRLEAQRLIFSFHPAFLLLAAAKSFVMLIYIQFYFDSVEGGWRRLCVCGTANIMSGLLTPVVEYATRFMLPLDSRYNAAGGGAATTGAGSAALGARNSGTGLGSSVNSEEEGAKDSALFAELLLSIAQLELNDLSTVLVQGSTFVNFAAVLFPVFVVFCVPGMALFAWIFVPLWLLYLMLRVLYYRGARQQPLTSSSRVVALVTFTWELLKTFMMKVCTVWLLQISLQVALLLGLSFIEDHSYIGALRYEAEHQALNAYHVRQMTVFQKICLASQLFL